MEENSNALNWFEIPATDYARAKKFYETAFNMTMADMEENMGMKMVYFPNDMGNGKVSGAILQSPQHQPLIDDAVLYLNANQNIQTVIDGVAKAGGQVVLPRTEISPEIGCMAFFIDSEGNKVGLHAQK